MSTLSDGLAARDKATKGPWIKSQQEALIHAPEGSEVGYIAMIGDTGNDFGNPLDDIFVTPEVLANMDIIAAAPDALDWIAKALPYLKGIKEGMEAPLMVEPEKYDAIRSLIAQAEGTEKDGENEKL